MASYDNTTSACVCNRGYRGDPVEGCYAVHPCAYFRFEGDLSNDIYPHSPLVTTIEEPFDDFREDGYLAFEEEEIVFPSAAVADVNTELTLAFWCFVEDHFGTWIRATDADGRTLFAVHYAANNDGTGILWEYQNGNATLAQFGSVDFGAQSLYSSKSVNAGGEVHDGDVDVSSLSGAVSDCDSDSGNASGGGSGNNGANASNGNNSGNNASGNESSSEGGSNGGDIDNGNGSTEGGGGGGPSDSNEPSMVADNSSAARAAMNGPYRSLMLAKTTGRPGMAEDGSRREVTSRQHQSSGRRLMGANTWIHVAVTRNTITGDAKIYINGTLLSTSPVSSNEELLEPFRDVIAVKIGGIDSGNGVDGGMDDLQVYNVELSAAEIAAMLNSEYGCADATATCGSAHCYIIAGSDAVVCGCPEDEYFSEGTCVPCNHRASSPDGSIDPESCICNEGYEGDGHISCEDVDECAMSPCSEGLVCFNTDGSYVCGCGTGAYLDDDGCVPCADNADSPDGSTSPTACMCNDGYSGDGAISCTDVDECAGGEPCATLSDSTCVNTVGSFSCECAADTYFSNDTYSCMACAANAESAQGSDSPLACECNQGYGGTGHVECYELDDVVMLSLGPDRSVRRPDPVYLTATITSAGEDVTLHNAEWEWSVTSKSDDNSSYPHADCGADSVPLRSTGVLQAIPGNTLTPGCLYVVVVSLGYADTQGARISVNANVTLSVVPSDLVVIIAGGGQTLSYDVDATLALNAEASYDPDNATAPLSFAWLVPGSISLPPEHPLSLPLLSVPLSAMTEGTFTFTVYAWSPHEPARNTSTEAVVTLYYGVPSVSTAVLYPKGADTRINVNDKFTLRGTVLAEYETTLLWSATTGGEAVDLPSIALTRIDRGDLALCPHSLTPGQTYDFTLRASATDNPTVFSEASRSIIVNAAPTGGVCEVSPSQGRPAIDVITVMCANWTDDTTDPSLLAYSLTMVDPDFSREIPLRASTAMRTIRFTLPEIEETSMELRVYVRDEDGGETIVPLQVGIEFMSTDDVEDACIATQSFVETLMVELMDGGLYDQALTEAKAWGSLLRNDICGSSSASAGDLAVSGLAAERQALNYQLSEKLLRHVERAISELGCVRGWAELAGSIMSDQLKFANSFASNTTETSVNLLCALVECVQLGGSLTDTSPISESSVDSDFATGDVVVTADVMAVFADGLSSIAGKVSNSTTSRQAQQCLDNAVRQLTTRNVAGETAVQFSTSSIRVCSYRDRMGSDSSRGDLAVDMWNLCADNAMPSITIPPQSGKQMEDSDTIVDVIVWEEGTHVSSSLSSSSSKQLSPVTSVNTYSETEAVSGFDPPLDISLGMYRFPSDETCHKEEGRCEFWDVTTQAWDSDGCRTGQAEDGTPTCVCEHLTDFTMMLYEDEGGNAECVYQRHGAVFMMFTVLYSALSVVFAWQLFWSFSPGIAARNRVMHGQLALFSLIRAVMCGLAAGGVLSDLPFLTSSLLDSVAYLLLFSIFTIMLLSIINSLVANVKTKQTSFLGAMRHVYFALNAAFFVTVVVLLVSYACGADSGVVAVVGQSLFALISFLAAGAFVYFGRKVIARLSEADAIRRGKADSGISRVVLMVQTFGGSFFIQGLLRLVSVVYSEVFISGYLYFSLAVFLCEVVCVLVVFHIFRSEKGLAYLRGATDRLKLLAGLEMTSTSTPAATPSLSSSASTSV